MKIPWSRLIRFKTADGRTLLGEPIFPEQDFDLGETTSSTGLSARVLVGDDMFDGSGATHLSDEVVKVHELLGPLKPSDVPSVRCVGLNYKTHIKEAGRTEPPYPSIFIKPRTSVHDHGANVRVPRICQDDQADYEGELCFVIGKDAKDVPLESAMQYIAAYTCGNDVSSRKWQRDPKLAGGVPQWNFSKGFDTYCPLGPCLVSADIIGNPSEPRLKTLIDGEVRQDTSVGDLLFDCATLVNFLSQGSTLEKGTVVMTGTPGGVGDRLKPPQYLKPGNMMEVSISKIGTLKNGIEFV